MKKIIIILVLALSIASCKKAALDPTTRCDNAAEKYLEKVTAFSTSPTKANCENIKSAAKTFLNDCPTVSAAERKNAQESIDGIDCSDF